MMMWRVVYNFWICVQKSDEIAENFLGAFSVWIILLKK
jgi:hypothetical protein